MTDPNEPLLVVPGFPTTICSGCNQTVSVSTVTMWDGEVQKIQAHPGLDEDGNQTAACDLGLTEPTADVVEELPNPVG